MTEFENQTIGSAPSGLTDGPYREYQPHRLVHEDVYTPESMSGFCYEIIGALGLAGIFYGMAICIMIALVGGIAEFISGGGGFLTFLFGVLISIPVSAIGLVIGMFVGTISVTLTELFNRSMGAPLRPTTMASFAGGLTGFLATWALLIAVTHEGGLGGWLFWPILISATAMLTGQIFASQLGFRILHKVKRRMPELSMEEIQARFSPVPDTTDSQFGLKNIFALTTWAAFVALLCRLFGEVVPMLGVHLGIWFLVQTLFVLVELQIRSHFGKNM